MRPFIVGLVCGAIILSIGIWIGGVAGKFNCWGKDPACMTPAEQVFKPDREWCKEYIEVLSCRENYPDLANESGSW